MRTELTIQEACDVLGCQQSTFYRLYRKRLQSVGKRKGSKALLYRARDVMYEKNGGAYVDPPKAKNKKYKKSKGWA